MTPKTRQTLTSQSSLLSNLSSPYLQIVHLFTLWGFAVAYPVYEVVLRNQGFLVMYQCLWGDILVAFFIISIGLPLFLYLLLGLPTLLFSITRLELIPFLISVWALISLLALKYLSALPYTLEPYTTYASLVIGLITTITYVKKHRVREFVSYMAGAAFLFPLIYLPMLEITPNESPVSLQENAKKEIKPHPVVVVIFDELSLGTLLDVDRSLLSEYFPNFARLQNTSTWYRDTSTVGEVTMTAVPAINTGIIPTSASTLPTYGQYPINLFTVLNAAGYTIRADEFTTYLCPSLINARSVSHLTSGVKISYIVTDSAIFWAHSVLPKSWHASLPAITNIAPPYFPLFRSAPDQNPAVLVQELGTALTQMTPDQRAHSLWYLHIALPHRPYRFFPSGKTYTDQVQMPEKYGNDTEHWDIDTALRPLSQQRYLLQLQYADTILGRILDHLEANKIFDESIIAVLADHGISFRSGSSLRYSVEKGAAYFTSPTVTLDVLKVPLFIKYAHQKQFSIVDSPTRTIDLFPTIIGTILPQFELKTDGKNLSSLHKELQYPITVLSHQNSAPFSHSLSIFNYQFRLEQKFNDLDWKNSFAPTNVCLNQGNLLGTTLPTPHPPSLDVKGRSIAPEISIKSATTSSVPGLLLGELKSHPAALAVAVDAQIVAFSTPIVKDNRVYINALIPEKYLTPGKHTVTVYDAADVGCDSKQ
jgi:hypothetical protein